MDNLGLGIALVALSGVLNGSFTYPMKLVRKWRWENIWLLFAFLGLLLLPVAVALAVVPDLAGVYRSAPAGAVRAALGLGLAWGTGSLLFGLAIPALGMSLGYAIVMGATAVFGTLVPAVALEPGILATRRGLELVASLALITTGLVLCAIAGKQRERQGETSYQTLTQTAFGRGLAIALLSGVFSACFNIGFALTAGIAAAARRMGASEANSTFAIWCLIMPAGFVPTLAYCAHLLRRNRSFGLFRAGGRNWTYALLMGGMWMLSVGLYGAGANRIGNGGAAIGWPILMSVTVIASTALGFASGEWRGVRGGTRRYLSAGLAALVGAVCLASSAGLGN